MPAARGAALGCAARVTWQKRDMTDLALPLPCVPGALSQAADSRECLARNAEHAGRLSCKGALDRMSPSAERALLPVSRGEDDKRAPVPTALLICSTIRSVAAQRTDAEPRSGSTFQRRDAQRRAKRGAEAPGQRAPLRRLLQRVGRPGTLEALFLRITTSARTESENKLFLLPFCEYFRITSLIEHGNDNNALFVSVVEQRIGKSME